MNLHGIVTKNIILYNGVGCNKSPWDLTAGEGHHDRIFYDPQGVILPLCIEKFDAEICLHYELTWNCQENHNIYRGGWGVTKAHGVLLHGRATMAVVFYDPQGVILPPCI